MVSLKVYLTRRNNGIYYTGVRQTDGKIRWTSTRCKNETEARAILRTSTPPTSPRVNGTTLSSLLQMFLLRQTGQLRERTLIDYERCIGLFLTARGDKPISSYDLSDIEEYKSSRLSAGNAPMTVNIHLRCIKALFNYAFKHEILPRNPFARCSIIRIPQRVPVYITIEDFRRLLEVIREPFLKDMVIFSALTGCRVSETINLQWSHVDFDKRHVFIRNTDEFSTKTGRNRTIPLHNFVFSTLRRRFDERNSSVWVFPNYDSKRFHRSHIAHRFKFYVRLLGLDESVHYHSLRHTCASWLVNAGVSLYEVQNILGHSTIMTTQIYAHLSQNTLLESVNKVTL
jgi:site-specific recombinase XerD